MKTQFVLGCLAVLGIAAAVSAFDDEPSDATATSATAEIQRELRTSMEANAQVSLLVDGAAYEGVPTSITEGTVTLQCRQPETRLLMRLDQINGVFLANSPEEVQAAKATLDVVATRSHLASWADAKIAGTVTMDGMPVDGLEVRFYFSDEPVQARTNEEGKYQIYVKRSHDDLGRCRVRFYWPEGVEGKTDISERYGRGSTLSADVTKGENVLDFALTSK